MAASPRFKVYDSDGHYVASAKDTYLAAAIVAMTGEGSMIKDGHRFTIWEEGQEDHPAAESYDFAAGLMELRIAERARLAAGAPRSGMQINAEEGHLPPNEQPSRRAMAPLASHQVFQQDDPTVGTKRPPEPLTLDSFRLITRAMNIGDRVRTTFTGRNGLHRNTIEGSVVYIGGWYNSFRLHITDVRSRGLDIGPATHNVFMVEILS